MQEKRSERDVIINQSYLCDNDWFFIFRSIRVNSNPILKKLKLGQRVSIFVGEAHRKKEGTPTIGGLIFIIPTVVATIALTLTDKIPYTANLGLFC